MMPVWEWRFIEVGLKFAAKNSIAASFSEAESPLRISWISVIFELPQLPPESLVYAEGMDGFRSNEVT